MKNKLNFSRIAMVLTTLVILGMIVAVPLAPAYGWPAPAPKSGVAPEQAVNTQVDPYPFTYIGSVKLNWAAPGEYDDTLTVPIPPEGEKLPELGSIDLGFLVNCSSGSLSGHVDLSTTLVFPELKITAADGTMTTRPVSISGTCSDPSLYILSEKFTQTTEAGQSVERQFQLRNGTLNSVTNAYTGEYRETIWGYGPQAVTIVGEFTLYLSTPATRGEQEYTLTVFSDHGTVTKDPDWATYHNGDVVGLSVTPDAGWIFTGWTPSLTNNRITITDNMTVTANFVSTAIFADVPDGYWAKDFIERLYLSDITGGCSLTPLIYCPENTVTRAQMAVLLLRGIHGSSYVPPSVGDSTGFADVPTDHPVAAWIKQLAAEGITGGCEAGIYCPDDNVTRAQMAVFLLRSKYTSTYTPPPASGIFTDVPVDYSVAAWIEQLAAEGITGGCEAGIYCPDGNVTRAQMAVFLVRTFNLP